MAESPKSKSEQTLLLDSSNSNQGNMDDDANASAQSPSKKAKKSLPPANRRLSKALSAWSLTLPSHRKQKADKSESEKRRLSTANDGGVATHLHNTSFFAAEIAPKISQDSSEQNKNRPLPPTPDKSSPFLENNATLTTQQFISTSSSHSKNASNAFAAEVNPFQSTCEQNALISMRDNALMPSKNPDTQPLLFQGANSTVLCKPTATGVHHPEKEVNFIAESTQNVAIDQGQQLQTKILPATESSLVTAASTSNPQPNYIPTPDKSAATNDGIGNNTVYLGDALQTYAECFPMRIKVLLGYCTEDSEYNLSTNDVYDIHFIKESHIITLKDADGSMQSVPLESTMMLGLLYDPSSDYDKALCGHEFEKCSDIMALTQMPKVICVTSPVVSPDPQNSIQQHEILAVIGTLNFKIGGKQCLRVYSFLENKEKLLTENCAGNFTTKPSMVFLHLQQIFERVNKPFPSQALLHQEEESVANESLQASPSSIVTLCESTTEKYLVASPVIDGSTDTDYRFNVPLNQGIAQIEIEVISWNELVEPNNAYDDTINVTKTTRPQEPNNAYDDTINVTKTTRPQEPNNAYDDTINVTKTTRPQEPNNAYDDTINVTKTTRPQEPNNTYDDTINVTETTRPHYTNILDSHNNEDTYAIVGLGIPKEKRETQGSTIVEYAAVPAEIDNIGNREIEKRKSSIDRYVLNS